MKKPTRSVSQVKKPLVPDTITASQLAAAAGGFVRLAFEGHDRLRALMPDASGVAPEMRMYFEIDDGRTVVLAVR